MKTLGYLNFFFFILLSVTSSSQISEWRGPGRTGIYNEKDLLEKWPEGGPDLLWSVDSLGMGYSSPSIADDVIYITGRKGERDFLTALDLRGNILWEKDFGDAWTRTYRETRTTPTVTKDNIFVVSGNGDISVFDKSGNILWTKNFINEFESQAAKFGISESPLVYDNKVIVSPGGNIASIVAYDIKTGDLIWKAPPVGDEPQYGSPLLFEHEGINVVATLTKNRLLVVNAETGDSLWTFYYRDYEADTDHPRTNHTLTPIYRDGCIFITGGYDYTAIKLKFPEKGERPSILWTNSDLDPHHGGVVFTDGYIYGSNWKNNKEGSWVCIDWNNGKTMWSKEWHTKGSIISADNLFYLYEERKGYFGLFKASPNSFEKISEFKISEGIGPHWAHPVIYKGKLYVRHGASIMVYCLKKICD